MNRRAFRIILIFFTALVFSFSVASCGKKGPPTLKDPRSGVSLQGGRLR